MHWKKYVVMHARTVRLMKNSEIKNVKVTIGSIFTGKQRVFSGYFCQIKSNGATPVLNENRWNLQKSLQEASREFCDQGYDLDLYGLQNSYNESGLTENSGYGYVSKIRKAVLMIDSIGKDE